jgi:hypothetical protein
MFNSKKGIIVSKNLSEIDAILPEVAPFFSQLTESSTHLLKS